MGEALQLAAEGVVVVQRFKGMRIQHHRRTVFLEHQQPLVMHEQLGIGRAPAQPAHTRIVGQWIAVHAEQRTLRLMLCAPAFVAHIARTIVHMTVFDAEHAGVTFAIKINVAVVIWILGVLRVRSNAIESAIEIRR
jgi:hypothetical protein